MKPSPEPHEAPRDGAAESPTVGDLGFPEPWPEPLAYPTHPIVPVDPETLDP